MQTYTPTVVQRRGWILLKSQFIGKTRKLQIFFAKVAKYDTIKHFFAFGCVL